ncbi:hypothetical protein ACFFGT_28440 [Mucilaginibacter angelicae]|uniref:Uncharacterized protein n=1 Tax=Mucilaginibacter angelicae TaxID=869718 RepID=A0ABV6LFB4_9SPHI
MKFSLLLCVAFILCICKVSGQQFNKSINKDSLFKTILKDIPEEKKKELLNAYNSGSEGTKEFLLVMYSLPKSSKKELIENIKANYDKITLLKTAYAKLVPPNYTVSIEFNPENIITSTKESIDLKITLLKGTEAIVNQEWNLDFNSDKLKEMLASIGWNKETVKNIKKLLAEAHCISIENGKVATIGFARSGLGKYSYLLFNSSLTADKAKQYNDGCSYIFYGKNIVLEYAGGAFGPQCFPD